MPEAGGPGTHPGARGAEAGPPPGRPRGFPPPSIHHSAQKVAWSFGSASGRPGAA